MKRLFPFPRAALLTALLLAVLISQAALAASYVYTTGEVHIRTGPGLDYASLGTVNRGTRLVYVNETSVDDRGVAWHKVSFGSSYGWVSARYSRLDAQEAEEQRSDAPAADSGETVWAISTVNIRSGPGIGYDRIGKLYEDHEARFLGNSSFDGQGTRWLQVEADGVSGWVSAAFVEFAQGHGPAPIQEEETGEVSEGVVWITGDSANLRSGPSVGYAELATLDEGETAAFLGSYATDEYGTIWYNVSYQDMTGWISSRYAEIY